MQATNRLRPQGLSALISAKWPLLTVFAVLRTMSRLDVWAWLRCATQLGPKLLTDLLGLCSRPASSASSAFGQSEAHEVASRDAQGRNLQEAATGSDNLPLGRTRRSEQTAPAPPPPSLGRKGALHNPNIQGKGQPNPRKVAKCSPAPG